MLFELGPGRPRQRSGPGVVRTRLAEALWKEREDELAAVTPLARIGEPEDVGAAVCFLASVAAGWITGETLLVDGGQIPGSTVAVTGGGATS